MSTDLDIFAGLVDACLPLGGHVVTFHHVYMDESGTHEGSKTLVLAGYLFSDKQAKRFSTVWREELARKGLPYAHMTDCATGNGIYRHLSMEERIDLSKMLINLIKSKSRFGFGVALDVEYFERSMSFDKLKKSAYSFCLALCVKQISNWAHDNETKVAYFFEAGHKDQTEANDIMNRINGKERASYAAHAFVDKRDSIPLQAADMLAWQLYHFLTRQAQGFPKMRKDFQALVRPIDALQFVGQKAIDQWAKLSEQHNLEILEKVKEKFSSPEEIAYAESLLRRP